VLTASGSDYPSLVNASIVLPCDRWRLSIALNLFGFFAAASSALVADSLRSMSVCSAAVD
jgi:hypothetical protein